MSLWLLLKVASSESLDLFSKLAENVDTDGPVQYKSGEVRTWESFEYGKFRAKIKAPNKAGTCTSFFTFFEGPKWSPELWNEIDFNIVHSVEETPISTNVIYGDGDMRHERHRYVTGMDPAD